MIISLARGAHLPITSLVLYSTWIPVNNTTFLCNWAPRSSTWSPTHEVASGNVYRKMTWTLLPATCWTHSYLEFRHHVEMAFVASKACMEFPLSNGTVGQYSKNQCDFFQCTYLCMMIIQSFFALVVDKIPGAHLLAQTRCWSLACRIRVGRFLLLVQLVLRLLAHYWAPWIMIRYSTWLCAGFLFINRRAVESISCCSWVQPRTAALWPLLRKWPHVCLPIPPSETLRVF